MGVSECATDCPLVGAPLRTSDGLIGAQIGEILSGWIRCLDGDGRISADSTQTELPTTVMWVRVLAAQVRLGEFSANSRRIHLRAVAVVHIEVDDGDA